MSDWRRRARVGSEREVTKSGGLGTQGVLFQGLVETATGTNTQTARLTYSGGERDISLPMPFDSTSSWIRSIPESGATALLAYRSDTKDPTFVRYLGDTPDVKLETYQRGLSAYRPLSPGEHEVHSKGMAQSFYSQRPTLEQRGGVVRSWLDQDKAESGAKSPLHVRQLHAHLSNEIGDEERFGVVRRPLKGLLSKSSNFYNYPFPDFTIPGGVPAAFSVTSEVIAKASLAVAALTGTFKVRPFAKEYLRVIKNPLFPIPPQYLIDIREGQVFDDDGVQVRGQNGGYLRAKHEYMTTLGDPTKMEIDEIGNINHDFSLGATTGWTTNIPFGGWVLSTGLDIKASTLTNIQLSSTLQTTIEAITSIEINSTLDTSLSTGTSFSHTVGTSHSLDTRLDSKIKAGLSVSHEAGTIFDLIAGTQANIKAPLVAVGQSPSEPMVMGTQLSTFLQNFLMIFVQNASAFTIGNLGAPTPLSPAILASVNQLIAQIPTLTSKTVTLAS